MTQNFESRASDDPLRGPFPGPGPRETDPRTNAKRNASVGELLADVPRLLIQLVKDEIEQAKRELLTKAKSLGIGAGLFAVAAFFLLTMWAVLVTAAILGLNEAFAPWLSALIVAGVFLVLAGILGLVGVLAFKKATPLKPEDTLESVHQDINAVKGLGQYE